MQITVLQSLEILTTLKNYHSILFNLMKQHHEKFNSLNNLKSRTENKKKTKTRSVNQC